MRQLKIASNNIANRSSITEKFFSEIKNANPLPFDEEVKMATMIKNGTPEEKLYARDKLILHNLKFVISVVKQYVPASIHFDDYIAHGYEGLIRATQDYDHTKGFKFISYAVWWIRQSVLEHASEVKDTIKIPHNVQRLGHQIRKFTETFSNVNGAEPTLYDIVDGLGLSEHNVLTGYKAFGLTSSDAQSFIIDDDGAESRSERLVDHDSTGDILEDASTNDARIAVESLLSCLSPKHRTYLTIAYDLDNKDGGTFSLARLAEYNGTTKEMARTSIKKIMGILRGKLHSRPSDWIQEVLQIDK